MLYVKMQHDLRSRRVIVFFKGKKILVIGGTGTVGRNVIKHLQMQNPKLIKVFSRDEYRQHLLKNELGNNDQIQYIIGDVRNYDRLESAMQGIDYVFHLAAMKHVPACEANPFEAVLTNIIGTKNVIHAAIKNKVKKMVYTSTDKAISPTNTYGATKLIAEKIIQSSVALGDNSTIIACVRFGNIIGSRGSVVPLFKNQIINDRKITATDLNMTRFMMTVDEATMLTMKALEKAKGGDIFVLKMPVITLKDLATVTIEETCHKYNIPKDEITIENIGLRPGEKMYEELMTYNESRIALESSNMFVIPADESNRDSNEPFKPAKIGAYSSNNERPLSVEEIRQLIKKENII